jgi:hypothetical protein
MKLGPANITSTDQFDYVGLVKMVEQGDLNFKGVVKLLDTQYVSANKLLSVPVPPEVKALRKSYSNYENMIGIIQGAEDIAKRIYDIMNAPEPPEEETFDRFKNYVLHSREEAKSQTIEQYSLECDEVESVEGDKIMFNAALDKFIQYSNASEMKDDILFLIKKRKLDLDAEIDVLGKSTSGRKIIAQLMRKYPNGLPGCAAFYRTTKEALLAGVMEF